MYRSLHQWGIRWKKNGPYNVKCRGVMLVRGPVAAPGGGGPAEVADRGRQFSEDMLAAAGGTVRLAWA